MQEIEKILENDEKVLWEGKPQFKPFILNSIVNPVTIFGIIWMSFIGAFYLFSGIRYGIFLVPHFWIGILLLFVPPIYGFLVYSKTYYTITNKRVIFQAGVVGRDFNSVDFDTITNSEVKVGLYDKLVGKNSGSILISTAGSFTYVREGAVQKPYVMSHITNPYEVYKFFSKISYDIKTDIDYPNKLRPEENPGYHTDYSPPTPPQT